MCAYISTFMDNAANNGSLFCSALLCIELLSGADIKTHESDLPCDIFVAF